MIDLKDFTIEELLTIYLVDPVEDGEPRESTDREIAAGILAEEIAADYLKRIQEERILELPIPLYSVVYAVTEDRAFNWESGKEPTCENQLKCNPDCELNGKECKILPFIEQKIYVPNSIWFSYITDNWGNKVFGTLKEAVKYINDTYGLDFCKANGLPVIDDIGNLVIPGLEDNKEFMESYNNEIFGKPVIPTINPEPIAEAE